MKVILLADIKKVGRKGETKEVSNGYAQNVLLPKKLALPGTPENLKKIEKQAAQKVEKEAFDHALLSKTLKELHGKTVTLPANANDTGTLFKAIHKKEIVDVFKNELGLAVPESVIQLPEPIKKAGGHTIQLEAEGEKISVTLNIG